MRSFLGLCSVCRKKKWVIRIAGEVVCPACVIGRKKDLKEKFSTRVFVELCRAK